MDYTNGITLKPGRRFHHLTIGPQCGTPAETPDGARYLLTDTELRAIAEYAITHINKFGN